MNKEIGKEELLKSIINIMERYGVVFDDGLSDSEVSQVETKFEFTFPPDLRSFLQFALPIKVAANNRNDFPNWRDINSDYLVYRMSGPLEGILFDVEHGFWLDELGDRPSDLNKAKAIMAKTVNQSPKLIPIYGHRYIPSEPAEEGNPVFSVVQTDIIHYGIDLWGYFKVEFNTFTETTAIYEGTPPPLKKIRFWSHLVEMNESLDV